MVSKKEVTHIEVSKIGQTFDSHTKKMLIPFRLYSFQPAFANSYQVPSHYPPRTVHFTFVKGNGEQFLIKETYDQILDKINSIT